MDETWLPSAGLQLGAWCGIPSAFSTELVCRAGFDWICIDTQHGMIDFSVALAMLQATAIYRTPAIVRVPAAADSAAIMKALDAGAAGVLVPMVNTREQAEQAVSACRYPPRGMRSWGPSRALPEGPGYSTKVADRYVVCAVQIETLEAIDNLEAILSVEGVDVAFVGPNDLSVAMGLIPTVGPGPGRHTEMLIEVARRAREMEVRAGIYGGNSDTALEFIELGYTFVSVATDTYLLTRASSEAVDAVRAAVSPPSLSPQA